MNVGTGDFICIVDFGPALRLFIESCNMQESEDNFDSWVDAQDNEAKSKIKKCVRQLNLKTKGRSVQSIYDELTPLVDCP